MRQGLKRGTLRATGVRGQHVVMAVATLAGRRGLGGARDGELQRWENELGSKPSGPAAQQLRQLILELIWPSQFNNRIVTHGSIIPLLFQDWRLDSSRLRHIPDYVRAPLSNVTRK